MSYSTLPTLLFSYFIFVRLAWVQVQYSYKTRTTMAAPSLVDHVDRVASRVSVCGLMGFAGGIAFSAYRGLPIQSTAIKVATSCAIVGTSLFATERIACMILQNEIDNERRLVLSSHAFSGIMGGGLNGYAYQKKPLRGMFFFLPIMIGVGFLELGWERQRQSRIREINDGLENVAHDFCEDNDNNTSP